MEKRLHFPDDELDLDNRPGPDYSSNIFIGLSVENEEGRASSKVLLLSLKVELFSHDKILCNQQALVQQQNTAFH